jgi:O-antigen/teichoic acid export membrane protein
VNNSGSRLRGITRSIGVLFAGQGGSSVVRYCGFILLTRLVSAAHADACAVYLTTVLVLGNLCDLGVNVACVRFAAQASTPAAMLDVQKRFLIIRAALTAIVFSLTLASADFMAARILGQPSFASILRLAAFVALAGSASSFVLAILQTRAEFGRIARMSMLSTLGQSAPVAALAAGLAPGGVWVLVCGDLIGRLIPVVCNFGLLRQAALASGAAAPDYRQLLRFSNWITASVAIGAATGYIPTIVLSRSGAASALADFGVGVALTGAISLFVHATMSVLLPEASRAMTPSERRAYVTAFLRPGLLLGGSLACAVWVLTAVAAPLAGPRYATVIAVFQYLATSQAVLIATNPIQFLLYGMDRVDTCTFADAAIAALYWILANMQQEQGPAGIAAAALVSQAAVKAFVFIFVLRCLDKPAKGHATCIVQQTS